MGVGGKYVAAQRRARSGGIKTRSFGKTGRLQQQANNNLGIVMAGDMDGNDVYRNDVLDVYDQYYESCQYDGLTPWDDAVAQGMDSADQYIPVRKRIPRIIYALPKAIVNKVASKLVGSKVFPTFVIESDPDDTEFFRTVVKSTKLQAKLLQPMRHLLCSGSVFVRYSIVNGSVKIEHYNSKYCYPQFDPVGELDTLSIKYIYEDQNDKDQNGNFKKKWYRLDLTKMSDILYNNPDYVSGVNNPEFKVVSQSNHNLGWVQGEWLRTSEHRHSPDGYSLFEDILDFFDELNYSLSQTSNAVGYNQDPQLAFKNIDEDELDKLIRSSQKGWNLGKDGEATFLETEMGGVEMAEKQRDHMRNLMLDVARIVIHDPEKMVAAAQSGRALEVLNAPLVELVDELRAQVEPSLINLIIKIGMTLLKVMADGFDTTMQVPQGYVPTSLDITANWPPIYPPTLDDLVKKTTAANMAATGHMISHETATRFLGKDFGVEDIDEELQKIQTEGETMPWLNPFGGGFGEPGQ